eukprot:jgi/Ulvmu1/11218/UM072_0055.1
MARPNNKVTVDLSSSLQSRTTEYIDPGVTAALHSSFAGPAETLTATDFTTWTQKEIIDFLDRRGEDHDDCIDFYALVSRAQTCEKNTGPATKPSTEGGDVGGEDDGDDALEAFMAGLESIENEESRKRARVADDCDEADAMAEYIEAHAAKQNGTHVEHESPTQPSTVNNDNAVTEEDQVALREIQPLDAVDHSRIAYASFKKAFYDESPDIFVLDDSEVTEIRRARQIHVSGEDVPKPVTSFEQCGFPAKLMAAIKQAGFQIPTEIQAQVLPAALSGRDILGIAKTGSGKTAAFLLPLAVHVEAQPRVRPGESPVALCLAPTRELAEQIHREARRFGKPFHLRCCAAFGGLQKHGQVRELQGGSEVAVATPGRMIDLVQSAACDLRRVTLLVVDEVDRCFDLGFEVQVRSLVRATRPDRQTLLFSATLANKVRHLVREALTAEVQVTVGRSGAANADVRQEVLLMANAEQKRQWLQARLPRLVDDGQVLVFVNRRAEVEDIVGLVEAAGMKAGGIHGDIDQYSRMDILKRFKAGTVHVLVATDVAARGLDVRSVKAVVNFDTAASIDTHVHRVGRTGRAGDRDGAAISLLMPHETRMAAAIAGSLQLAGQDVSKNLHDIAMKDKNYRQAHGGGRKPKQAGGGAGLGFNSSGPPAAHPASHTVAPPPDPAAPEALPPPPPRPAAAATPAERPLLTATPATPMPPGQPGVAAARSRFDQAPPSAAPAAAPPAATVLPAKRGFSQVSPAAAAAPAATLTRAQQSGQQGAAMSAVHAPQGFVRSSESVGGGSDTPQIVMPSATPRPAEAPAPWLQKRLQQRAQGRGSGFGGRPAFPAAPVAKPVATLDADAVARAIATAKAAAARVTGGATVAHAGPAAGAGAAAPVQMQQPGAAPHSQPYLPYQPHAADPPGHQPHASVPASMAAAPSPAAPRLTPEEARRIAQEAARRVSESAAGRNPQDWTWSKS